MLGFPASMGLQMLVQSLNAASYREQHGVHTPRGKKKDAFSITDLHIMTSFWNVTKVETSNKPVLTIYVESTDFSVLMQGVKVK